MTSQEGRVNGEGKGSGSTDDTPASTKPLPVLLLSPLQSGARSDFDRRIELTTAKKVGRAVANRTIPAVDNAIFDSKVLSRAHAEVWHQDGKIFIRDTKSSNGTWLNEKRLCEPGEESSPFELKEGDRLRLGVDIRDDRTVSHSCVIVAVSIELPGASLSGPEIEELLLKPIEDIKALEKDGVISEFVKLRGDYLALQADFENLAEIVYELKAAESDIGTKMDQIVQIVDETSTAAQQRGEELAHVGKLSSRIESLDLQVEFYKRKDEGTSEETFNRLVDKIRESHEQMLSVQTLIKEKQALESDVQKWTLEVASLRVARDEVEKHFVQKKQALDDRTHELSQVLEETREECKRIGEESKKLRAELAEQSSALCAEIDGLKKTVAAKDAEMEKANKDHETSTTALKEDLAGVEKERDDLAAQVETVNKEHTSTAKELKNVKEQLAKMESELKAEQEHATEASDKAAKLQAKLDKMDQQLANTKETVKSADSKLKETIENIKQEQEQIVSLEDEVSKHKEEAAKYKRMVVGLCASVGVLALAMIIQYFA